MKRTLRIFGIEVVSYEVESDPVYELVYDEPEEEAPEGITGGATHDFERDLYPPDPSGEEPAEWEFTFGFNKGG